MIQLYLHHNLFNVFRIQKQLPVAKTSANASTLQCGTSIHPSMQNIRTGPKLCLAVHFPSRRLHHQAHAPHHAHKAWLWLSGGWGGSTASLAPSGDPEGGAPVHQNLLVGAARAGFGVSIVFLSVPLRFLDSCVACTSERPCPEQLVAVVGQIAA